MAADPVEVINDAIEGYVEWYLNSYDAAKAALAALDAAGLVVVPRVATENMLFAGLGMHDVETARGNDGLSITARTYTAMLAAGPAFTWRKAG